MSNGSMKQIDPKEALTLASPYPYTLAVTLTPDGKPNAIGISWWTFTSMVPPMLLISVGHTRYSYECLKNLGEFALCFPAEDQAEGAWLCGTKSGRKVDKFPEAGFTAVPSEHIEPPKIEGCTVAFECRVVNEVDAGDHAIFIADILGTYGTPGKEHHIFTIQYREMLALGSDKYAKWDLK
jgi:flavin reductase (DIM6/NTAB) family NADH-FMN oxidoreductase RutF